MPTELLVVSTESRLTPAPESELYYEMVLISRSGWRCVCHPRLGQQLSCYARVQLDAIFERDAVVELSDRFNYCEVLPNISPTVAQRHWAEGQPRRRKRKPTVTKQPLPACQPVTWRRRRKVE